MEIVKKSFNTKCGGGLLTFLESERDIPFAVRRVYYIYDLEDGARRGFHAHKTLRQYLICVCGSCEILLDNGAQQATVSLNGPSEGLYVGPNVWHEMYAFSPGAVLLVLASDYYDENDYIRNYDMFLDWIRERKND